MAGRTLRADLFMMAAAVIWGGAFVAQRAGMEHMGPLTFNGVRFALGALTLLPVVGWVQARAAADPDRMSVPWGGALAGTVLFGAATLQQVGLVYTTAGKAGFITGLYVILVPLLGLFLGHRCGAGVWVGAGLATAGLYLLSVTQALSFAPGDLWVLAGAFLWACHVLVLGWLSPRMDSLRLACVQFTVCAGLSLMGAGFTEVLTLDGLQEAAIPILYGGALSVGVAYTLQVVGQRHAPPAHAAIILSMEAVFAALAGWALLGESMTGRSRWGCLLMLSGILAAQLGPSPEGPATPAIRKEDACGQRPRRVQ